MIYTNRNTKYKIIKEFKSIIKFTTIKNSFSSSYFAGAEKMIENEYVVESESELEDYETPSHETILAKEYSQSY